MNLLKGEVPLKAENKEYKLKFTTNALCELEDLLDMGISEILQASLGDILTLKQVRGMLYCACMEYHREEVSLEFAGQIIDVAGYKETWTAVVNAIAACLPDKNETSEQKKTSSQEK